MQSFLSNELQLELLRRHLGWSRQIASGIAHWIECTLPGVWQTIASSGEACGCGRDRSPACGLAIFPPTQTIFAEPISSHVNRRIIEWAKLTPRWPPCS
ncbi:hypothetical protein J6590_026752, partial [Homalodisca vitripennis]